MELFRVSERRINQDAEKLNESGGRLFELLSEVMICKAFPDLEFHSQPPTDVMHIAPDIFLGSASNPRIAVLVTHATVKNAAGMKTERNIEELFELKTRFRSIPIVINMIWHSPIGWSDSHLRRQDEYFDVNWVAFRDCPSLSKVLPNMAGLADKISGLERPVAKALVEKAGLLSEIYPSFVSHLKDMDKKNGRLWNTSRRAFPTSKIPGQKISCRVKLDLTQLCAIPSDSAKKFLEGADLPLDLEWMSQAIDTGVYQRQVTLTSRAAIPETGLHSRCMKTFSSLPEVSLEKTIENISQSEGFDRIQSRQESEKLTKQRLDIIGAAVGDNNLCDLFSESFRRQSELYTGRCWPIELASNLIKANLDDNFGLTFLQRSILGDNRESYKWNSLTWYVNGDQSALTSSDLKAVAGGLEQILSDIKFDNLNALVESISSWRDKELRKGKKSNPLLWFVKSLLDVSGVGYEGFPGKSFSTRCPACDHLNLPKASGITRWHFRIGDKILHVLSNYSSSHKDKEYSAKTRLSYCHLEKGKYFVRPNHHVAFILDGEWSEGEVSMFKSAGSHVFPADEVNSWLSWINE
jgi:hypothetical protein